MRLVKPSNIRLTEDTLYKNISDFYVEHPHNSMGNYFLKFCRYFIVRKDGKLIVKNKQTVIFDVFKLIM